MLQVKEHHSVALYDLHCWKGDQPSQWKMAKLGMSDPQILWTDWHQFNMGDYVSDEQCHPPSSNSEDASQQMGKVLLSRKFKFCGNCFTFCD